MPRLIRQLVWFVIVGCAAAATHWIVAVGCVEQFRFHPLLANVVGWLTALSVSFVGHFRLTFRHQSAAIWTAAWRFFVVSATSFLANEAAFALLLKTTSIPYDVLLFIVLLAVAVFTFVLSRYWAFRKRVS